MTDVLMILMAGGAVLGGIDHMLGNRLGFGQRFEEAFRLLGAIALSMAGVSYGQWVKWTWKIQVAVLALTVLVLLFAVGIHD